MRKIGWVLAVTCLSCLSFVDRCSKWRRISGRRWSRGVRCRWTSRRAAMTLPAGFTATLFAGEPDVHQPIGFCIDHRGRLWVAENDSYPKWEEHGKDRIVIFEDTDGDGKFDKRTVFAEGLHYLTGVQVGLGGVWVMDSPNLLFFPVKDGEDKPAGPAGGHARRVEPARAAQRAQLADVGAGRVALRVQRDHGRLEVGVPGTPDEKRVQHQLRRVAVPPDEEDLRAFRRGDDQPVGPRL